MENENYLKKQIITYLGNKRKLLNQISLEVENILKENPLIVGGYDIRGGTKDPISVKALCDLVDDRYMKNIIDSTKIHTLYTCIIDKLQESEFEYVDFISERLLIEPYIVKNTNMIADSLERISPIHTELFS